MQEKIITEGLVTTISNFNNYKFVTDIKILAYQQYFYCIIICYFSEFLNSKRTSVVLYA